MVVVTIKIGVYQLTVKSSSAQGSLWPSTGGRETTGEAEV